MNMKQRYQAKQQAKQKPKPGTGPRTIPGHVALANGVTLKAMPFVIVEYNDDGSPKTFELVAANVPHDMKADGACVLFAQEEWIRAPQPARAKAPPSEPPPVMDADGKHW